MVGAATIMLKFPYVFTILKYAGGAYLLYLGLKKWTVKAESGLSQDNKTSISTRMELISQGFITAIANPKAWIFFLAFIPPFIDQSLAFTPQILVLLLVTLLIEFCCLIMYALGGSALAHLLQQSSNVQLLQ